MKFNSYGIKRSELDKPISSHYLVRHSFLNFTNMVNLSRFSRLFSQIVEIKI